jgi:hypothetical protein
VVSPAPCRRANERLKEIPLIAAGGAVTQPEFDALEQKASA